MTTIVSCNETSATDDEYLTLAASIVSVANLSPNGCPSTERAIFEEFEDNQKNESSRFRPCNLTGNECIKRSILYVDDGVQRRRIRDVQKLPVILSASSDEHGTYSVADDVASDNEKTYSISETSDNEIALKFYPDSFEQSDSSRSLQCDAIAEDNSIDKRVERCLSAVENIEQSIKNRTKYEDVVGKIIDNYYNLYSKRLKAKAMMDESSSDSSMSSFRSNSFSNGCGFETSSPDGGICREQTKTTKKLENSLYRGIDSSTTCNQSFDSNHKCTTNNSYRSSIFSHYSGTSSRSSIDAEETATTTTMSVYPKSNESALSSTSNDDPTDSSFDNIILEPPDMFKTIDMRLHEEETYGDKYCVEVDLNDNIPVSQSANRVKNACVETQNNDDASSDQSEISEYYKDEECNSMRTSTTEFNNLNRDEYVADEREENAKENCAFHAGAISNGRRQFATNTISSRKNDELIDRHDDDVTSINGRAESGLISTTKETMCYVDSSSTHPEMIEANGSATNAFNVSRVGVAKIVDRDACIPFIDEDISECSSIRCILDEEFRNFDPGGSRTSKSVGVEQLAENRSENNTENGKLANNDSERMAVVLKNIDVNLEEKTSVISVGKIISNVLVTTIEANSNGPKISSTGNEAPSGITRCEKSISDEEEIFTMSNDREYRLEPSKIDNGDHRGVEEQVRADTTKNNERMTMPKHIENAKNTKIKNTDDGKHSNSELIETYVEKENSKTDEIFLCLESDRKCSTNGKFNAKKTSDHDQSLIIWPNVLDAGFNETVKDRTTQEFHPRANEDQQLEIDQTNGLKFNEKTSLCVSNLEAIRKFSEYFEESLRMDSEFCEGTSDLNLNSYLSVDVIPTFDHNENDVQVTSFVNSSSDSDLSEEEESAKHENLASIASKDTPRVPFGILKTKFKQNLLAKSNRVRFDESLNKFFEADYVILIQDDDDDDDDDDDNDDNDECQCNDQYCCDRCYYGEEEDEDEDEVDGDQGELDENLVDSSRFDFAAAFEPPVDFVDVFALSPPEKYKDGCCDPDFIPINTKPNDGRDETSSKADLKTEQPESIQDEIETIQKLEFETKIVSNDVCKEENTNGKNSTTLPNGSTSLPNGFVPPTNSLLNLIDSPSDKTEEIPKAIERCIVFNSGVQLNYVEFTPPSYKSIGGGGILKGGKQWRSPDSCNESSKIDDSIRPTSSTSMRNIVNNIDHKRVVKFSSREGDEIKHRKTDDEPPNDNDFTLTFTLGNLVVPCNSLKPNSAVRQLFPDPRYSNLSAIRHSKLKDENFDKCEGKFLVTEESLRAFNEVNKRSVFATFSGKERHPGRDAEFTTHSDDEDIPRNNLIRKAIEKNALRRNFTRNSRNVDGLKRINSCKKNSTKPSLEERIKQLTYIIENETINETKQHCDSDLMLNRTSKQHQQSPQEQRSFMSAIRIEPKRTPSVQEARKQFLSSLACDTEISEHSGDRLSVSSNVSTGTEYSVGDIDEALGKPAKSNADEGAGATDSQDELAMFVMQDASRIERIKRRYSSAPASSPSPAASSSDEHDNFSFSRRPSIRGIGQPYLNLPVMSKVNGANLSPMDATPSLRLNDSQEAFSNDLDPTNILATQYHDNNFKQSSQSLHLPSPTLGVNGSVSSLSLLRNNSQNQNQNSFANDFANGYSLPLAKTGRYQSQLIHFNYTTAALAYQSLKTSSIQLAMRNQLLERGTSDSVTNSSSPTFGHDYVKLSPMQLPRADDVQQGKLKRVMYGMNV